MSSQISDSKAASILTDLQLNPEIGSDDAAFVTNLVKRAARFLTDQIHLDRYPETAQGISVSGTGAATDLESSGSNQLLVSIDDDQFQTIEITLSGLTSGALIASELQAQIRAIGTGSYKFATVAFDAGDTQYTITSPTFGESSVVNVSFDDELEDVAIDLKLSPTFGGLEFSGGDAMPEYDDMVIALVTHSYNRVGVEGMKSHSVPGSGSYTEHDIDPAVASFITNKRRIV